MANDGPTDEQKAVFIITTIASISVLVVNIYFAWKNGIFNP